MKCGSCNKPAKVMVDYTQISFCKSCYEKMLFKRLKKWFRNNKVIDEKKVHVILDDGSVGALFLIKFFKKFFSYPGLKWVVRKRLTSTSRDRIILLPTTLTEESDRFLHSILTGQDYEFNPNKNVFKPLTVFLETDLLKWRRFKKSKPSFKDEHEFLDEISKRRPMVRFSIKKHLEQF